MLSEDDTNVQTAPRFIGATSGEVHDGHLIYFPPDATHFYLVNSGQGATPTQAATAMNATLKAAMVAGDIPWGIVVYANKVDPDDSVESWGVNAADGSFDYEDMMVYDLPAKVTQWTGLEITAANTIVIGFSEAGFITLRLRAKFDIAFASAYVVMGAPRLDADFPTPAATYTSFSAAEKTKLWDDDTAILQMQSPIASSAGTALFNVYGDGSAPLLLIRSDDGAGSVGDTTTRNSMNNAVTELGVLGVTFVSINVFENAAANKPGHVLSEYMAAWALEGGGNGLDWIGDNL
jgi:hypothetical protein